MKLNIADPSTGCQKTFEIEDEKRVRAFYDQRIGAEIEGDAVGEEYNGYIFKITGGCDLQGFPMMQGILDKKRVRLLLDERHTCFRPTLKGERRRKSVRGCIVSPDLSVLHLIVVKKGLAEIEGVTNDYKAKRLGPKRANNIRKLFALSKKDDVKRYVVRRQIIKQKPFEEGEPEPPKKRTTKAPKIQRLVTPERYQRKRRLITLKKRKAAHAKKEEAEYKKLLTQRRAAARQSLASRKLKSTKSQTEAAAPAPSSSSAEKSPDAKLREEKKKKRAAKLEKRKADPQYAEKGAKKAAARKVKKAARAANPHLAAIDARRKAKRAAKKAASRKAAPKK